MGRLRVAALLALAGCFFDSRVLKSRSLSPRHDAESRAAGNLLPAPLQQPGNAARRGPVRVLKVRVWTDAAYRRRAHWREHVERLFARANNYLRDALGVELQVETREWERDEDVEDLGRFLEDLERHDPGDDVDHVVGMTGALPRLAMVQEMLGRAATPGKHLVVRALTDALEHQTLAQAFPTLTSAELDQLSLARNAHKEDVILVHEWAHNYGALHEDGRDLIMSPGYTPHASRLSEDNLELVRLAIGARGGDAAAGAALRRHIAEMGGGSDPSERAALLEALGAPEAERTTGGALDAELARAEEQRAAGRFGAALERIDALRAGATQPAQHAQLAQAYFQLGAYTRAAEEVAAAGTLTGVAELRDQILLIRRQRGVYGVAPADEPDANAAVEAAHAALSEGDRTRAPKLIAAGLSRWPRLAGLLALRCALELEDGKNRVALATCGRALASGEESVLAHYFAGHAAARTGKRAAAIAHFERALALDPDSGPARQALEEMRAK